MNKHSLINPYKWACGLFLAALPVISFAAPLDDVSLQQSGDEVLATIKLTTPVHFLRYVPAKKSRIAEIYYERIPSSDASDPWVDREERSSPATDFTPAFTVTTRDQAIQPKLVIEFASEVEFSVRAGADNRSFVITLKPQKNIAAVAVSNTPLPLLPSVVAPVAEMITVVPASGVQPSEAVATGENVSAVAKNNQQAYGLMLSGRDALAAQNYPAATEAFNKLLLLPPNQYSQDAQEWVGVARERGGQADKAKVEYELYLKLYTTGQGVQWVKQRLAGLSPVAKGNAVVSTKKIQPRSFAQGSISSRYYYGQSTQDTTYQQNGVNQMSSYFLKDQSSLISNVDATQRFVNENFDNRIVFRDALTQNFLPNQPSKNRINSAYFELKNRTAEYSARLGRQTTGGGGVMGRFDGVSAGYGSVQELRVNAVAGKLVDFTSLAQPIFYGVSVDKGMFSVYAINQTIEGVLDRRAAGAELKYFEGNKTAYAMVEGDAYFKVLNAAMLSGTYGMESTGTTFNFIGDYRKSPAISTRNALNGAFTTLVKDLLLTMSEAQLRQLAKLRTGSAAFSQLGVTQKVNENWQLGGDLKLAKTSGLASSGIDPATGVIDPQGYVAGYVATGLERAVTAQLIGSKLYSDADITSFGSSLINSDYVKDGQTVFVYNRTAYDKDLVFDSSWNYYRQSDNLGGGLVRNMPMLRVAYQFRQQLSFDADIGLEMSSSSGPYQATTTSRQFGSLGLRWDF